MMKTTFEQLREDDAAHRAKFSAVYNAIWHEFAATDEEFVHEMRSAGPSRRWIVMRGDERIGVLAVERSQWNGKDAPAWISMVVYPDQVDTVVLRAMLRVAGKFSKELGFDQMRVLCWDRDRVAIDLLESLDGWLEVERAVDVALDLANVCMPARTLPAGVQLTTLAMRPDLVRQVYDCLDVAIGDIPGDESESTPPFDEWLAELRSPSARDEAIFLGVREAGPGTSGDEVVGFSALEFGALQPTIAWHGFTAVRPAARGLGIAYALKVAAIRYAQEHGCQQLRTENEARNAPIRHINAALGYKPVAARIMLRGPIASIR